MGAAGRRVHRWIVAANLCWAVWALVGGVALLNDHDLYGQQTVFHPFGMFMFGYQIVGWSLVFCGVISLLAVCVGKLGQWAALTCAVWCGLAALALQLTSPLAQADIDTWLLLMCSFSCVMRWGLYALEPYVDQ